jgi:hypothetical protein
MYTQVQHSRSTNTVQLALQASSVVFEDSPLEPTRESNTKWINTSTFATEATATLAQPMWGI